MVRWGVDKKRAKEVTIKDPIIIKSDWKKKDSYMNLEFDLQSIINDLRGGLDDATNINSDIEEKKDRLESLHEDIERSISDIESDLSSLSSLNQNIDQLTVTLQEAEEEGFYS